MSNEEYLQKLFFKQRVIPKLKTTKIKQNKDSPFLIFGPNCLTVTYKGTGLSYIDVEVNSDFYTHNILQDCPGKFSSLKGTLYLLL